MLVAPPHGMGGEGAESPLAENPCNRSNVFSPIWHRKIAKGSQVDYFRYCLKENRFHNHWKNSAIRPKIVNENYCCFKIFPQGSDTFVSVTPFHPWRWLWSLQVWWKTLFRSPTRGLLVRTVIGSGLQLPGRVCELPGLSQPLRKIPTLLELEYCNYEQDFPEPKMKLLDQISRI